MAHSRRVAVGVTLLLLLVLGPSVASGGSVEFIRGDADANGLVSAIPDALFILFYLAGDGDPPTCFDAADVNGDGGINIVDPIRLLSWGLGKGLPPDEPRAPNALAARSLSGRPSVPDDEILGRRLASRRRGDQLDPSRT